MNLPVSMVWRHESCNSQVMNHGTHLYGKFSEGHEAWTFDEVV